MRIFSRWAAGRSGSREIPSPSSGNAMLDRASYGLLFEQPRLVHALVLEWLARV